MPIALEVWQSSYSHDRRAHRHRCACCRRILNTGDAVLMFRSLAFKGTKALHEECADRPFSGEDSGFVWRDMAVYSAIERSVRGFSISPKAVFNAATDNLVAARVDFSFTRLCAFGLRIDDWPRDLVVRADVANRSVSAVKV
jgi:hypothetical protein